MTCFPHISMQDLDECKVRPDVCKGGRCINTDGSFRCECPAGYILDHSGLQCVDADECAQDPRICGNGTCTNTPGGYECRCNYGFTQGPEQVNSLTKNNFTSPIIRITSTKRILYMTMIMTLLTKFPQKSIAKIPFMKLR